jgi:hypothetical protein
MDELCSWFEVIRSLLPQHYEMRIIWELEVIMISTAQDERLLWLSTTSLAGRTPSEVVETVRSALRVGRTTPYVLVA